MHTRRVRMSWKVTDPVMERIDFCRSWEDGQELDFSAHCQAYGISRKSGYKWLRRYEEEGMRGLFDRSRAKHTHANQVSEEMMQLLVTLRGKRPHWGPKKLVAYLAAKHPGLNLPAPSTAGDI